MDPFEMNHDEILRAVKNDVGLIQGKRIKSHTTQEKVETSSEDESENSYYVKANGAGDDVTKVLKMECCVFKQDPASVTGPAEGENSAQVETDLERMLVAYCFQYDIPYVPKIRSTTKKAGGFHQQHRGEQSYGDPSKSKTEKSNFTASTPATFIPLPSGIGKIPTSSGGGGGGKRPPRPHNVKRIPSDVHSQTDTTSESDQAGHHKTTRNRQLNDIISSTSTASGSVSSIRTETEVSERPQNLSDKSSKEGKPVSFQLDPQIRLIEGEPPAPEKLQVWQTLESREGKKHKHHKDKLRRKQRKTPSLISTVADISQTLERDHEWLDYTTSEDETRDQDAEETEGNRPPEERERPVDPDLQRFVNATVSLYGLTTLLGLDPYQRVVRGNKCIQVKWNPRSGEFIGMCFHAALFFLVTVSAFMSMGYIAYGIVEPATSTHQVLQVEFANHVTECLFIVFISLFLSVWSVSSVMELGIHYAEFMSRVNFGICLTKYDVTEGVQSMIIKSLSFTGSIIVVALLLFFGGRTKTSTFREACGFIGFAVIRPLNFQIRESIYYPLVEILGLLIALYSLLCFNVVILQFMVYAKALENMARRFNLRLVHGLGQVYEGAPHQRKTRIKKYIPLSKLYAEHRIVTSLFHQFGQVNSVILSCFLLVVALEVMLLMWVMFQMVSETTGVDVSHSNKILHRVETVTLAVPLRLKELQTEVVIKAVVLFDLTVIGFLKFGGVLHTASDTLHVGMEYIRRHGLMLCRNSKERRFILTMISSYAPKAPYWIGKSFRFNRSSILEYLTFLVGASMVFASFNPSRTTSQYLQQCDENGDCVVYKFQKSSLDRVYALVSPPSPGKAPPPASESSQLPPSSSTTGPKELENQLASFVYLKTLSISGGSYPYDLSLHSASCPSKWSLPSQPTVIFTPYLYRQLEFTDATGKHNYFAQVRPQFAEYSHSSPECADLRDKPREQITFPVGKTSACVSNTFACHYFPFQSAFDDSPFGSEVVDGFSRPVSKKAMDDCRNLNITTADPMGKRVEALVRVVYTGLVPGASDPLSLLCCYEYGGYNTSLEQARVCNMPDTDTLNAICLFGTSRSRMKGEVLELHDEILRRIQDEVKNDNLEEFVLLNEEIIAGCLCRLDGTDPSEEEFLQCRAMQPIPCIPGSYPKETLFTLECGPNPAPEVDIHIPLLLLVKTNPKLLLPVEHQRYGSFCPGARFKDNYFHDDDLYYKDPFEPGGPPVPITDCSGNPIVGGLTDSDDCRNWRIATPNLDGEMKLPTVILKQNDYNSRTREFAVGVPAGDSIFVCCFHYASDIFQRNPTQLTFCNAPSIRAMNHPEWCSALAQNGIRNSPTFPYGGAAYQKLTNKLKVVSKYYSIQNNGENLLDSPVEQGKWQKCICSDLIRDLELSEIKNAVDICIKSIPTPCELVAVGEYDAYSKCPVGWPQIKEMVYPKIFTIENGIWEQFARFVTAGAPRADCPSENASNWENDPNLDNANIQLFDCFLDGINFTKDDCGIYNIPVLNGKGVVTKPTKIVNPEYTLTSYNVANPRWAAAHCCYHYSGYDDQWKVCNLPNSDSFLKKCDMSNRAPQRLAHEREFSRMAMVEDTNFGAVFKGNLVPTYDATTEDSRVRKLFDDCICQNTNHAMCEAYYLPPCIAPKVSLSATIQVDDTYTRCDHAWNTAQPDFLRIPVIREFDKNAMQFKKLARFRDGSTPADCPNGKTTDILTSIPSGMTISDCYGDELGPTSLPVDDCGNPFIRTPKRTNMSEWEYPTMHLIPLDRMPGMTGSDVYCCFLYPISNVSEVNVCNMPDAGAVRNKCKERNPPSKTIEGAIGQFKEWLRGSGSADLFAQPLDDQGRALWTECICGWNESICNSLSPPCFADLTPGPPEPLTQQWVDKMYYTCQVPTWYYSHGVMYYPRYYRFNQTTTAFIPLKAEGHSLQSCSGYPKDAEVSTGQESEVFDCEGKDYGSNSLGQYFRDDCQNVRLPYQPDVTTKLSVRYNRKSKRYYVLCCNNYPRDPSGRSGLSGLTWDQADTCNTVSETAFETACRIMIEYYESWTPVLNAQFTAVWVKVDAPTKRRIEGDTTIASCVCKHLEQWKYKFPGHKTCTDYIDSFNYAG